MWNVLTIFKYNIVSIPFLYTNETDKKHLQLLDYLKYEYFQNMNISKMHLVNKKKIMIKLN